MTTGPQTVFLTWTPLIKLALLIPTLDRSGAEKQLVLLATRLPRDEFDVQVIALTRGGPYEQTLHDQGIPVTVLGKRWKFDPAALSRLRAHLRRLSPHVLHTWLFAANAYGRLAAGSRPAWKTVVSERCVDSWKASWQLWLDRRLIPRTDRLVANSSSVAEFYRQHGFPAERITVINNGIELPGGDDLCPGDQTPGVSNEEAGREEPLSGRFVSTAAGSSRHRVFSSKDRAQLLSELELPPGAKLVGHVGRLAKQKRVDDLLWAAQVLRQADERAYFLVIGDGPERDRLVQHAHDVECVDHVRFLGHRSDAAALLAMLDVYWLGSDFEGMSNSLMEAMAAGIPVVVTDIPPNRELVMHGEQGYLVRVGDGVGFAQFTKRLLQDESLARKLGDAGRRRMEQDFNVQTMVDAHAKLYRDVCGA